MKRLLLVICALWATPSRAGVSWQTWSDAVFARAKAEHRYVVLDLGAVWCHWCHVMEDVTYQDASVAKLLDDRFIAVRADQDADPELSQRYEDWGWPATIVFAPDGSEIVKRRGYLPPPQMAALLAAIIADPSPGPSVVPDVPWQATTRTQLTPAARATIEQAFRHQFDDRWAGWGTIHKYLDAEAIGYALATPRYRDLAYRTLDAGLHLIDPVWGGMYQYSDEVDWKSPHYEKIMAVQTQAIAVYLAARDHDPRYLAAARAIAGYLRDHLTGPDGALFTSQDADRDARTPGKAFYALDDAGRRRVGAPPVDTHIYPRENGWAIAAFARLYAATHDGDWLARARRAADWIDGHRLLDDGAYRHGDADRAGPYLGDTLAMAEAQLALAEVDPTGPWLARAQRSAKALDHRFAAPAGFISAPATGPRAQPVRAIDDNVAIARLARALFARTQDPTWRAMDQRAMRYLASPTLVEVRPFSPGVLRL